MRYSHDTNDTDPTESPSTPTDFHIFDTTLRDGAQMEGLRYSVADKMSVARLIDELGVDYIEGGWPGALPSDTEFFERASEEINFKHAKLVAFGMTRRAGIAAADDEGLGALIDSRAPTLCLVAKSDIRHVRHALKASPAENLEMIRDSISYGREYDREVFIDCEHFFDGFRHSPDYATTVVKSSFDAGADVVVLCDTNGGSIPSDIARIIGDLRSRLADTMRPEDIRLGIHAQNDTGCAVANTLTAVESGVMHVQGTANGYGERPGNADIFSVIGGLQTKMGMRVLPPGGLEKMTHTSHSIAAIANMPPNEHAPYVGHAAFAHKAGLHASAIKTDPGLYNHIDPQVVGNDMRILVTEMAGRASIELKSRDLGIELRGQKDVLDRVTKRVKDLEAQGWSFEAADASFELLLDDELPQANRVVRPFTVASYRVIIDHTRDGSVVCEATVRLEVDGEQTITTAQARGPVNALDAALRQALAERFPGLSEINLSDYKVRILAGTSGTEAITRVLTTLSDGDDEWTTVGVDDNIVEASWRALIDALTYRLR